MSFLLIKFNFVAMKSSTNILSTEIKGFLFKLLLPLVLILGSYSLRSQTTTALQMNMEWLSSTSNTADFQIRLKNTGTSAVTFNALVIRGVHAPDLTTGTITWMALNDNPLPEWLNWPNTGTTNLPYTEASRKLSFSSANNIFNSLTAQAIPSGAGVLLGTFRISTTSTWSPDSDFGFTWEMTSGGVVGYVDGANFVTDIQHYGVSGGTICGQCLTVTASSAQPLNQTPPPSSSILTGDATICSGATTNLSVAVTGGISPYTVTVTDGTNNYSATGSSPVIIAVSPTANSTYNILSVTGGGTGTGNSGSATVTVNQPTLLGSIQGTTTICAGSTTTLSNINSGGTWSSSNISVASINPSSGVVTANNVGISGSTTITYSYTNMNGCASSPVTTTVNVNQPTTLSPISGATSICAGSTTTLSNINSGGTWSSSNPSVAGINSAGVVTPMGMLGSTTITYSYTNFSNGCPSSPVTTTVTVNPSTNLSSIFGATSICAGSTTTLSNMTSGGYWSSSDTGVATINSSSGVVTANTSGSTTITYSYTNMNGCISSPVTKTLTVNQPTLSSISGPYSICLGSTATFSSVTSGGTWSSSNYDVASIDPSSGVVPANSMGMSGSTTITYSYTDMNGCASSTFQMLTVNQPTSLSPISGATSICAGSTTTLSNSTSGGTWSSSNPNVYINYDGVVTANTSGSTTITYSYTDMNVCTSSTTRMLTVNQPTMLSEISAPMSICAGSTATLSNSTSGGTWSSSNTSVASINPTSGVVTANTSGSTTITYSYTNMDGCISSPVTRMVYINEPTTLSPISGETTICAGLTTTLFNSTSGGTWSSSNTSVASINPSSGVVTANTSGSTTITYSYTNMNGCISSVTATVTVTAQPTEPAKVNCWDTFTFNATTCEWVNNNTAQPSQPAKVNCWDTFTFNTTTCVWDNNNTAQPSQPAVVNCWDNFVFNTTTCVWTNIAVQPTQPPKVNCWDTFTFNTSTCVWDNNNTPQPTEPVHANCWDTYTFNTTTCAWVNNNTPQTVNTTTVSGQTGSYTWANNGQTYNTSGTYTGTDVNCVSQVLILTINASLRMDMEWLSSGINTADFQIRLTNTGTTPVKLNSLIIRGVHTAGITTGAITWKALNDNTLPGWLNWPNTGSTNLPYIPSQRKLNFSSSTGIFTSATAQPIPSGSGVVVGTFRLSTTTNWVPNSNFGFVWEMTSGGIVGYVGNATTVTNIQHYATVTTASACASCLAVTASTLQPLNPIIAPTAVLSGSAAICPGASTNLSVAVTDGQAPYTVTVTDGTNSYTATGSTSPLIIAVSPTALSTTYTISSLFAGIAGTTLGSGSATVTIQQVTTTVTGVNDSYTWANNGQTYTATGIYTGTVANCAYQVLNLTINPKLKMDMEWLSSTANTADFQIRLTNTGATPVKFNALIIRGAHAGPIPSITTGEITWRALNDNTLLGWLNWPNTGTTNLPYITSQRKLNFSSSTGIFSSATAQPIPSGTGVVVGTFRVSTTTSWVPNSDFGFLWEMTSGGLVGYVNGATTVTNFQHYGSASTATTCASCLTVTASSAQPLNPITTPEATLSGSATICAGTSTNLSVAVTGGQAPYTVTVSDGINSYTATGASPLSITVSPSATATYSISSITGGITGTGSGTATVTITPLTTTGSVTTSICEGASYTWPANGVTYETAQSGVTVVTDCNTATLNLTITPLTTTGSVTTSICAGASYTWPANGVTYETAQSGVTFTSGCNTATLNLTITPLTTTGSVTTSICAGASYTWPVNGVTYETAQSGVTVVTDCNTATLNLTITPLTTTGSVTTSICAGASYTWPANGVTYETSQSGVTVVTDCNTATLNLTVNTCGGGSVVNLTMFIQGYYAGNNTMTPVKYNQWDLVSAEPSTLDVEDMTVELHDAVTYALVYTAVGTLHTDGHLSVTFNTAEAGSYYIAVKGSNLVQTWSAIPLAVGTTPLNYDFSTSASQAYGDNMQQVEPGVFAMYQGDFEVDDLVDLTDYSVWEAKYFDFAYGEEPTDLNGDGLVDLSDYSIWEANYFAFIFAAYPF